MQEKTVNNNNDFVEKKFETSHILDKYYSVQFSLDSNDPVYMFKLRDISCKGLCILVKENSDVLKHLKVNETLSMEYNSLESQAFNKFLKTRISDISKKNNGDFAGHYLIGLSIIGEHNDHL
jgi:hypothetical protein